MVDIMDEMSISSMQRFALVEITDVDKDLVKRIRIMKTEGVVLPKQRGTT